jgi:hypothetical protein
VGILDPTAGAFDATAVGAGGPAKTDSPTRGVTEPRKQIRLPITDMEVWEGSVTEVEEGSFQAILLSAGDGTLRLSAEFRKADLSSDDKALLAPGASFYVTVWRVRHRDGRIEKRSSIGFRRLAPWRQDEIDAILAEAKANRRALGFEDD